MNDYNNKVKLIYKLLSRVYDLMDLIFFPIKRKNPRLALAKFIPNDILSVLDVCTGTGNTLIAIASNNNKNQVTGIDLSSDMLKVSRQKLKKLNLENTCVQEMDATKIQIKDNNFDIVSTSLSLHEMPIDVFHKVLAEMKRVTKKGGNVCIIEWDKPESFLSNLLFSIFPSSFEPKGFKEFLNIDWNTLLSEYGLTTMEIQKHTFSKLIITLKE